MTDSPASRPSGHAWVSDTGMIPPHLRDVVTASISPSRPEGFPEDSFLPLARFDAGENVHAARELLRSVAAAVGPDGTPLRSRYRHRGVQLWAHAYFRIFTQYCLPWSRFSRLVEHCNLHYEAVHLAGSRELAAAFRAGYRGRLILRKERPNRLRRMQVLAEASVGVGVQLALSALSLPFLAIVRNRIGTLSLDYVNGRKPWDFRFQSIYESLEEAQTPYTEFLWSPQAWRKTLAHAWMRRKPVFYTSAWIRLVAILGRLVSRGRYAAPPSRDDEALAERIFRIGTGRSLEGLPLAIAATAWIFRLTGVRAFFAYSLIDRTFVELAACRLAGIPAVGIVHGMPMPDFTLWETYTELAEDRALDLYAAYGAWSAHAARLLQEPSGYHAPGTLQESGYLRRSQVPASSDAAGNRPTGEVSVLWISEPLLDPDEAAPYLDALLSQPGFKVSLKVRPMYEDRFHLGLVARHPGLAARMELERGNIFECLSRFDVAVGSHSTGVLDALLVGKPFVLFNTRKWEDCFGLQAGLGHPELYAREPARLVPSLREALSLPPESLRRLREDLFGPENKDGARWVAEKLHEFSQTHRSTHG